MSDVSAPVSRSTGVPYPRRPAADVKSGPILAVGGPEVDVAAAIRSAQQGDEDAFRLVYREVHPLLLRYLRALVGDDAEDVAAEAWLQIVRDLGSFRGDHDGFRGWAATIARRRAIDHLRRIRRRSNITVPTGEIEDVVDDVDPAVLAVDNISTYEAVRLISTLPPDQAEAVLLRAVVGLDSAAAGRVLGKRPGAVRTAAYRGLQRLAERVVRPVEEGNEVSGVTSAGASTLRKKE